MARHNETCDGVADLAGKAFTPTHMRDDPKIYTSCVVRGEKDKFKGPPSKEAVELKGDLLIRDIWTQGTDIIHNISVVNTDTKS